MKVHTYTTVGAVRDENQDRHTTIINDKSQYAEFLPINYFAIFDGHGGKQIAHIINKKLHLALMSKYHTNDQIFKLFDGIQKRLIDKHHDIATICGTTALVILYMENTKTFTVINLGDCRAVVCTPNNIAKQITNDHTPFYDRNRINVVNNVCHPKDKRDIAFDYNDKVWRVGQLSVCRAFGDLDNTPQVTHVPEITPGINVNN